jgi:hypothetical protein
MTIPCLQCCLRASPIPHTAPHQRWRMCSGCTCNEWFRQSVTKRMVDCWKRRASDRNKLAYQWRWRREWRPSLSVISAAFIAFGRSCLFANTSSTASLNSSCKCNKSHCYHTNHAEVTSQITACISAASTFC